jgi:hypothetical protein
LKKKRLDFMEGWITSEELMAEKEEPEVDMLAELFGKDSKDVFDSLMDILGDDEVSDVVV